MLRIGALAGVFALLLHGISSAAITYGFDDGTFQGWELVLPDGSEFPLDESDSAWIPSNATIDIGDGFNLVPATSGSYRVVPDPFGNRDCIGLFCYTQVLRSPAFYLDGTGDLTIDMIGGGAQSNRAYDPLSDLPPEEPEDLVELKDGSGYQGFALLDMEANSYVAYGFSSFENDGKARPTDPATRANWETVSIPQADLSTYANDGKQYRIDIFDSYSGGWGWIGFDTVVIPGSTDLNPTVPGDFDGDGNLDGTDIETLSEAVRGGSTDPIYDLDGSGTVDNGDRLYWVEELKNTFVGDSNLDGEFNSGDFVAIFTVGEYEDQTPLNSTWADGDWNGDADFNSSDFVLAFTRGGFEQGPRNAVASSVPEPASVTLLLIGLLAMARGQRHRGRAV